MTNHPITSPPELVASLRNSAPHGIRDAGATRELWLINKAYAAGADQELEACVAWLDDTDCEDPQEASLRLRWHRRPKPPSLKEQALEALTAIEGDFNTVGDRADTIRRALNELSDN